MSRQDKFPDCMALSSKREACLGYREAFTKLDLAEKEIKLLRALLIEADRLITLEGVTYDPGSLRAQIAEALNQQRAPSSDPK